MTKLFQIITDSSCDLPQSLADELDLRVLPLHVTIDGKTYNNYLDGREIAFKDFFDKLRAGSQGTTSAVNPEEFCSEMEPVLAAGLVDSSITPLSPGADVAHVSRYFATYDLVCAPVVNDQGMLLGAVTVDDVLDHILPNDWRRIQLAQGVTDG